VWFWLEIGAATVVALTVVGGAALVVILRNVGRELSELLELEPVAMARPIRTRARRAVKA
jgi:HAMP domain-containing protein